MPTGLTRLPAMLRRDGGERPAGRWIRRRYTGTAGTRLYDVYVPGGARRGRMPMVLLLHGCRQTGTDFGRDSGFAELADTAGFVLVMPRQEVQHQLQRCWRWYDAEHQQRDEGEPAILRGIVDDVPLVLPGGRIDRRRVFVAGLSAGGAMALILATTYPDVFAAAGVHSATAYRSATRGVNALGAMAARGAGPDSGAAGRMAPVVLLHGTDDAIVRPPNADRIVDQWLASRRGAVNGPGRAAVRPLASTKALVVGGRRCLRTRWYTVGGRRVLEYWRVDGLGHAWSGGSARAAFIDRAGPSAAQVMWTFFGKHRGSAARGGDGDAGLLARLAGRAR